MSEPWVRVETTIDTRAGAERLARLVIEERLVACAQVTGPITSFYRWEGAVQSDEEWLVVMKTGRDRLSELSARLRTEHSYDVPEVIAVPVDGGNPDYLEWLLDETRSSRR